MLVNKPGKQLIKYVPDYVLFDLETTGISCKSDEVVEISALKVIDGFVEDEFSTLVNPGIPIPFYASDVNGITDEMVKDAPSFETALGQFAEFAGDSVLVGHYIASFDMKFIQRDAEKYFGKVFGNDYIDTLVLSRLYLPELEHHSLTDLARYYHMSTAGAHRALADCRMNQRIFESLKEEIENPSDAVKALKRCPRCGNMLKKRTGKLGEFWGCRSYPDCRYTENISSY
ncbi:MAG: topoisomerase DNA-binding C4 zinc finger domain-containing protein [Lachnospiraceae bacterium]|nr:topoisomerase DNA-binding C4 zinc finger domain-containing protein [Lachnospiraceae bacterium]